MEFIRFGKWWVARQSEEILIAAACWAWMIFMLVGGFIIGAKIVPIGVGILFVVGITYLGRWIWKSIHNQWMAFRQERKKEEAEIIRRLRAE